MSAAASSSSNRRLVLLVLVALGLWFFRDSFTTDAPPARKPALCAQYDSNSYYDLSK